MKNDTVKSYHKNIVLKTLQLQFRRFKFGQLTPDVESYITKHFKLFNKARCFKFSQMS